MKTLLVCDLRPIPSIDDELDWFFNLAACEMGVPSNFHAILRHEAASAPRSPEDAVEASHRDRRIRRWLRAIPDSDAGVLHAAYALRDWPVALFDVLGRLTGIVVRIACARAGIDGDGTLGERATRAHAEWLASLGAPTRTGDLLATLRREAEGRYARAHQRYAAARGGRS